MTAFRVEVEGSCVVTLTCDDQGNVRQEIQVRGRALHVAEFCALQGAARASAPPPDEAAGPPEGWAEGEGAEEGYAAALAGPVRLEPSRASGRPRPAPAAPRPREI